MSRSDLLAGRLLILADRLRDVGVGFEQRLADVVTAQMVLAELEDAIRDESAYRPPTLKRLPGKPAGWDEAIGDER